MGLFSPPPKSEQPSNSRFAVTLRLQIYRYLKAFSIGITIDHESAEIWNVGCRVSKQAILKSA